ncbi:hypothetical protein AJ79_04289 [Helicocarpus griseus UAMH5409]|uniref:Uncharacterized protein n=1 Tax=Helicocarpus griseus UAMH5409 TaxID=1447875 RepID=A0A2B7XUL3_9EURO|nr:hypothetical protein AJ79_04289 [Helicocarpus griseus UAMH5409]
MTRRPDQREDGSPSRESLLTGGQGGGDSRDEPQTTASESSKNCLDYYSNGSNQPSDTLRRAPYIVLLTLGYAAIAIFAWAVICTLAYRPIGAQSYVVGGKKVPLRSESIMTLDERREVYAQSERFLRAARILQNVASVMTIPMTSAICSYAAVIFLQRGGTTTRNQTGQGQGQGPTLRQSLALADKGWYDPVVIAKLFTGKWKQYGSRFLVMAIILNVVGVSIAPLQGLFVSYKAIKVPDKPDVMYGLMDIPKIADFLNHNYRFEESVEQLRSKLMSAHNEDPQFRLWSSQLGCGGPLGDINNKNNSETSRACTTSGHYTFGSMSNLSDPFWAQMPSGFSTGHFRQFAPRFNYTARYEDIVGDAFPPECNPNSEALFFHYENATEDGGYNVDVCMPAAITTPSPWKATYGRQDFSEELYVRMNLKWERDGLHYSFVPGNYSFKITLNTTASYFELPNYMNGQLPSPILDNGPDRDCGWQCPGQTFNDASDGSNWKLARRDTSNSSSDSDSSKALNTIMTMERRHKLSKLPLFSTAMALFGPGSYLDIKHTSAEAYHQAPVKEVGACIGIVPFIKLLHPINKFTDPRVSQDLEPCISGTQAKDRLPSIVADYMYIFVAKESAESSNRQFEEDSRVSTDRQNSPTIERIQNAFAAAAFLTTDMWHQQAVGEGSQSTADLNWDMGVDQQIPALSLAGMILVSILLGLYLASLLALSVYSAWIPRWTEQLNSFAVMRMSAALADQFPLRLAHSPDNIKAFDELPGWVGGVADVEPDAVSGQVGELALGGEMSLRGRKKYRSYSK